MTGGPERITARQGAQILRGAKGLIFLAGSAAEPRAVLDAADDLWSGLSLTGPWIPGVNDRAPPQGATFHAIFATPGLRRAGWRHLPLHYSAYDRWLSAPGRVEWAVATLPPPSADGTIGLGPTVDFLPGILAAGARLIAVTNPALPDLPGTPRLPLSRVAALVEGGGPLPGYDPGQPDPALTTIAARIPGMLAPGDTLQLGLGKLAPAVLAALAGAGLRGLHYHGGMITAPVLPLIADGTFATVTTGVAVGDAALYAALRDYPQIAFRPVSLTHDHGHLSRLPGLLALGQVLEIDLTGQANAEALDGRQIGGQGGLVDFIRGARAAPGGRSLLALPAAARGGTLSRIVAALPPGTPVSVARGDIGMVATEYGTADLSGLDLAQRAETLTALAAPQFRDTLAADVAQRQGGA